MSQKIVVLSEEVRRKIAAGEVIDRPASVLRELIDNSVDAGARTIDCSIEAGGSSLIQVLDTGHGMSDQDLNLCWLSHATSKINSEDDLLHLTSLGFRGEALFSIAAVSRLEILTRDDNATVGSKLVVEGGQMPRVTEVAANRGTRIKVGNLFFNLPARKRFIGSVRGESLLCRNVFIEKAIPHPGIGFKLFSDQKARIILPALEEDDYLTRIATLYPEQCPHALLHQISGSGEGFSFKIILGLPPLHRSDRKYIHIYCNRRRISEFSLIHAVEYAFSAILPGGQYPVAFVFLNIDPADIDINIHPAKKEVRFQKPEILHRRIRESIQQFVTFYLRNSPEPMKTPLPPTEDMQPMLHPGGEQQVAATPSHPTLRQNPTQDPANNHGAAMPPPSGVQESPSSSYPPTSALAPAHYRYLGQIFSVFLLAEVADELYIIDMHAAHERILFDRYQLAQTSENLLIPMIMQDEAVVNKPEVSVALNRIGFKSTVNAEGHLVLSAMPTALRGRERLIDDILTNLAQNVDDLETALYAGIACRTAVKDGDILDSSTACEIIEQSWQLPIKRCPHGRPIWFKMSKTELFKLLGRIV